MDEHEWVIFGKLYSKIQNIKYENFVELLNGEAGIRYMVLVLVIMATPFLKKVGTLILVLLKQEIVTTITSC